MTGQLTYILNFGHPLSKLVLELLTPCKELLIPCHFVLGVDEQDGLAAQIQKVVNIASNLLERQGAKLNGTVPLLVVLPGVSEAVAILLAELHGRLGFFPQIVALRKEKNGTFTLHGGSVNKGVVSLDAIRSSARGRRV